MTANNKIHRVLYSYTYSKRYKTLAIAMSLPPPDMDGCTEEMDVLGEYIYWWRYQSPAS